MLDAGEADIGIATESLDDVASLASFPFYEWRHAVIVPRGHPLASARTLSLEELARHPLITYHDGYTGRARIDQTFAAAGLSPDIVLTALDSDVIKTYVELGLGVGILAKMAFDAKRDVMLRAIDASHLFESSTTRLGIKRGAYLRRYAYDFIGMFAPHLPATTVEQAVKGQEGSRYEL